MSKFYFTLFHVGLFCQLKNVPSNPFLKRLDHCSRWPLAQPERSSGWRSGMRHYVLLGNWQPSDSWNIFGWMFCEPQFLHLHILRKALQPLAKISVLHDEQQFSTEMCAQLHVPLHQNLMHIKFSPPFQLSEQFLRAIWEVSYWATELSKTLNQFNSQLLHCALF